MTKEQTYDEKISPLMAQIIAICKKHKIAFIADFRLDGDLSCTSADLRDSHDPADAQIEAFELLKPRHPCAIGIMTETKPNGDKKITMTRIS